MLKSQRGVKGGYSFAREPGVDHRARGRRAARRPARPRQRRRLRRGRRRPPARCSSRRRSRTSSTASARTPARRCTTSERDRHRRRRDPAGIVAHVDGVGPDVHVPVAVAVARLDALRPSWMSWIWPLHGRRSGRSAPPPCNLPLTRCAVQSGMRASAAQSTVDDARAVSRDPAPGPTRRFRCGGRRRQRTDGTRPHTACAPAGRRGRGGHRAARWPPRRPGAPPRAPATPSPRC